MTSFFSGLSLVFLSVFLLPEQAWAFEEMNEQAFLDLVEKPGHVLITATGVDAVNAEAKRQGLRLPAIGYWSPDDVCFRKPPQGDCNGLFRR
jgi:hypothetical protein